MDESPKDNVVNRQPITVEYKGRILSGTYVVWRGTITVTSGLVSKSALVGRVLPQALARIMLRELAEDGQI